MSWIRERDLLLNNGRTREQENLHADLQTEIDGNGADIRRCPLCGETRPVLKFYPKRAPGPVVRCENCEMVYVSPLIDDKAVIESGPVMVTARQELLTSSDLDDFVGSWELALLPQTLLEQPAARINSSRALDWIQEYVSPPGRLLDFGSGWGFFLALAGERGWGTHGLDPLPCHSAHARSISNATIVTDILRDDTFSEQQFDVITAFQAFEHLPDPEGDLHRLRRTLKPDGIILVEVPNIDTLAVRLLGPRHRHFVEDHLTFFSASTLSRFLSKYGFEVLSVRYPTRRMSVRHLVQVWIARYFPKALASGIEWSLKRSSAWNSIVPLNFGDIVAVLAKKT